MVCARDRQFYGATRLQKDENSFFLFFYLSFLTLYKSSGPFLERPGNLFISTGFATKQSLQLCSFSNLRIFLVFQLRTFKVGFSGPKTFPGRSRNGPQDTDKPPVVIP